MIAYRDPAKPAGSTLAHRPELIKEEAEMSSEEIKRESRPGRTPRAAMLVAALPARLPLVVEWPARPSK
jgi:hypothetical protein